MADLEASRKRLSDTLRDRMQKYWDSMKDWYKRKITKDDFDAKAKHLLGENNLHLHNEFLFAVLVKCQVGSVPVYQPPVASPVPSIPDSSPILSTESPRSPTPFTATATTGATTPASIPPPPAPPPSIPIPILEPPKPKKPKLPPQHAAELPHNALDVMRFHDVPQVQMYPRDLDTILLCVHEFTLPDLPTMHTRMLLVAWELGLDGVSEEAAALLSLALQLHLKNVLQALISSQISWVTKEGTNFRHSFGQGPSPIRGRLRSPSPSHQASEEEGSSEGKFEEQERREAKAIRMASLSTPVRKLQPLNLFHLRDALRVNRHCIPVHSVYCMNMERILAGMWHLSKEEEEQKKVVDKWQRSLEKTTPFAIPTAANYGRR